MNGPLFLAGLFLFAVGLGNVRYPRRMFEIRHWPVWTDGVPADQMGFTLWQGLGAALCVLGILAMFVALL